MKPVSTQFLSLKGVFVTVVALFSLTACGSSSGDGSSDDGDSGDTVNTEKLIGTPFEGMTRGDDLQWGTFLCGQYRTETVDSLPT